MTYTFAAKLGPFTQPTDIGFQTIDSPPLTMYGIVVAGFSL